MPFWPFLGFFTQKPKNAQKSTFLGENKKSECTLFSQTFKNTQDRPFQNMEKFIFKGNIDFLSF